MSQVVVSQQTGYARNASESAYPNLWDGLLAWYCPSITQRGSLRVFDISGRQSGVTLSNINPVANWIVTDGKGAIDFDGSNDFGTFSIDLSPFKAIAISFWFKYPTHTNSVRIPLEMTTNYNNNPGAFLFTADDSANGGNYSNAVRTGTGGSDYLLAQFAKPTPNAWHHWLVNFRITNTIANGGIETWIDGVRQSFVSTVDVPSATVNFRNATVYIASRAGTSFYAPFQLDDFRIYRKPLSQGTVELLSKYRGIGLERSFKRKSLGFDAGIANPVLFYNHYVNQGFF
jgi:hypothetical protein